MLRGGPFQEGGGNRNGCGEGGSFVCGPLLPFPLVLRILPLLGLPVCLCLGLLLPSLTLLLRLLLADFPLFLLASFLLFQARLVASLLLTFLGFAGFALGFFPLLNLALALCFLTLALLLFCLPLGLLLLPLLFGLEPLFLRLTGFLGSARFLFSCLFGFLPSLFLGLGLLFPGSLVLAPLCIFGFLRFALGVLLVLGLDLFE